MLVSAHLHDVCDHMGEATIHNLGSIPSVPWHTPALCGLEGVEAIQRQAWASHDMEKSLVVWITKRHHADNNSILATNLENLVVDAGHSTAGCILVESCLNHACLESNLVHKFAPVEHVHLNGQNPTNPMKVMPMWQQLPGCSQPCHKLAKGSPGTLPVKNARLLQDVP